MVTLLYSPMFFREYKTNDVHLSSKTLSGLDAGEAKIDLKRTKNKKNKENVMKNNSLNTQNNKKKNGTTNNSLINYDYHPIISFFNDY